MHLAALRRAAEPLAGLFGLPTPAYEHALQLRDAAQLRLSEVQAELGELLFDAVRNATDEDRGAWIKLKRAAFNGRPLPTAGLDLPPALSTLAETYEAARASYAGSVERAEDEAWQELRATAERLLATPKFAHALRYGSATLANKLRKELRKGRLFKAGTRTFRKEEAGLYRYAARFFSKANPLYLFAELALPENQEVHCRIEAHVAYVGTLERERLADGAADVLHRQHLRRPVVLKRSAERVELLATENGYPSRRIALRASPALDAMLDAFEEAPVWQRGPLERRLHAVGGPVLVEALVERDVLAPFLVTADAYGPDLDLPDAWHRSEVQPEEAITDAVPKTDPPPYVNAYGPAHWLDAVPADPVADDLKRLKPLFALHHDGLPRAHAAHAFAAHALRESTGKATGRISFTTLLSRLAGRTSALDEALKHSGYQQDERRLRLRDLVRALHVRTGLLSEADVDHLLTLAGPTDAPSICFNGPIGLDAGEPVFGITNVWDGDGRFLSRHRPGTRCTPETDESLWTVQLYDILGTNLNAGERIAQTGTGLDDRYATRFEHWMRPEELTVIVGDAPPLQFEHTATGRRVRVRFHGCGLVWQLPPAYKLLLAGQPDTFSNPFTMAAPVQEQTLKKGQLLRYYPGARYQHLVLRREAWAVPASDLPSAHGNESAFTYALRLRDWANERFELGRHAYYAIGADPARPYKPRYVDFEHPLSLASLVRDAAGATGWIRFEPMDPNPEHLLRFDGHGHVAELMLEL